MLHNTGYENSFRMKNLNTRPSPDLAVVPRHMHHTQRMPRQWMPPPGQMPRIMTGRPMRFSRPTRRGHHVRPISVPPPMGSRMIRGSRYLGSGTNRFYPLDQHGTNVISNSIVGPKSNDLVNFSDALHINQNFSFREEVSTTMAEKSGKSVMKKKKKKGSRFFPSKYWNIHDAEKALKVELETIGHHSKTLVIKFPDPEISWDTVKSYHPAIEKVHFQIPSGPRYCTIKLSEDSDVDQVMKELKEITFHNLGNIKVEKKYEKFDASIDPELIDPYTLYVGNLPLTINPTVIKEKFPTAVRIDVGYAQRMKYTRYAFIRYQTVEESIEAFRDSHNVRFDSRNLVIRFRRQKKNTMPLDIKEEASKSSERKRPILEHTDVLLEKKIKIEEEETDDENYALMMSEIVHKVEPTFEDMGSEEEKEVEDYDEEDDDDIDDGGKFNCMEQKEQERDDGDEMEDDRDEEGDENHDEGDESHEEEDENNDEEDDINVEGDKNNEEEDDINVERDENKDMAGKNREMAGENREKGEKNLEMAGENRGMGNKNLEGIGEHRKMAAENREKGNGNDKDSEIKKI